MVTSRETMTALRGMFHPGVTWCGQLTFSVTTGEGVARTHVGEGGGEGHAFVAGKGPELAGGGGDFGDAAGDEGEDDDGDHEVRAGETVGCVVDDLDEGEVRRRG